jgi:fumarate reductase flavoprotein subunit
MGGLYEAIDAEIAKGGILKAQTLPELAQAMGVDPAEFATEISRYNADCQAGHDSVFDKARAHLQPITAAPFYAVRAGMDIITTHGGIRTDSRMRVLRPDCTPIQGLYAAGIDISGVDSGDYSVNLSGHAFGFALTGGRLAAQEMLQ